jgi:hypothetical protein
MNMRNELEQLDLKQLMSDIHTLTNQKDYEATKTSLHIEQTNQNISEIKDAVKETNVAVQEIKTDNAVLKLRVTTLEESDFLKKGDSGDSIDRKIIEQALACSKVFEPKRPPKSNSSTFPRPEEKSKRDPLQWGDIMKIMIPLVTFGLIVFGAIYGLN